MAHSSNSAPSTASAAAAAHAQAVKACREMVLWGALGVSESDAATYPAEGEMDSAGTQLGTDFQQWVTDVSGGGTGNVGQDADTVEADCSGVGINGP